jgi:hypothetical protein
MDLASAAALARGGKARVWYGNLVEYAAAVKLLGVGGASWEGGRYCYRLPVAGGSSGKGQEQCQVRSGGVGAAGWLVQASTTTG